MDIKKLEQLVLVRLDVSIWPGRAKLRKDELSTDVWSSLPSSDVLILGSKRLYDPAALKIFNTLKARAASTLDKKAVRFLGGWAAHISTLDTITKELASIASEFKQALEAFVKDYNSNIILWANDFPEYKKALLNAAPDVTEVKNKFSFNWQAFAIAPLKNVDGAYMGDNLIDSIENIENMLLVEVVKNVSDIYKECFRGKTVVTKKAFRPVHTLADKLYNLSFMHKNIEGLFDIIQESTAIVEDYADSESHVSMFKNFLLAMDSPENIIAIVTPYIQGEVTVGEVFDNYWETEEVAKHIVLPPGWNRLEGQQVSSPGGPSVSDVLSAVKLLLNKREEECATNNLL